MLLTDPQPFSKCLLVLRSGIWVAWDESAFPGYYAWLQNGSKLGVNQNT